MATLTNTQRIAILSGALRAGLLQQAGTTAEAVATTIIGSVGTGFDAVLTAVGQKQAAQAAAAVTQATAALNVAQAKAAALPAMAAPVEPVSPAQPAPVETAAPAPPAS